MENLFINVSTIYITLMPDSLFAIKALAKVKHTLLSGEATDLIMEDWYLLEGKISKNIVNNDDIITGYLAGAFSRWLD